MTVTVEMKIKYFSMESGSNSFTVEQTFETYEDAVFGVSEMIQEEQLYADADGAMMDTFYYEYDYLMDESVAIENNLMAEAV